MAQSSRSVTAWHCAQVRIPSSSVPTASESRVASSRELAELTDYLIQMKREMLNLKFRLGMQQMYGPATDRVRESYYPFIRSLPLAVRLPGDAAFALDAESRSGGITVDHPLTVQGKISKRHIRGEVRGGGPLLRIDTGSGSIRVE